MTQNSYGAGTLLYEGTMHSDALQQKVVVRALRDAGVAAEEKWPHGPVRVNRTGNAVHHLLNYSGQTNTVPYNFAAGRGLLTRKDVAGGER